MTPLEILRATRARIANPDNWTKDGLARNEAGEPVHPEASDACQWCLLGAERSITDSIPDRIEANDYIYRALRENVGADLRFMMLSEFNDTRSHEEVLAVLDRAIVLAEQQQAGVTP